MEDKKNDEEKGGKSIGEGKGHAQTNRHVGDRARSLDSLFAKNTSPSPFNEHDSMITSKQKLII